MYKTRLPILNKVMLCVMMPVTIFMLGMFAMSGCSSDQQVPTTQQAPINVYVISDSQEGYEDAMNYMDETDFQGTDYDCLDVISTFNMRESEDGKSFVSNGPNGINLTEYQNGVIHAIRDKNNPPQLAPGIAPTPNTIVYSIWGSTTYHRQTCRFIINSKKPASCLFSFTQKKAQEMGIKVCSSCFKEPKAN